MTTLWYEVAVLALVTLNFFSLFLTDYMSNGLGDTRTLRTWFAIQIIISALFLIELILLVITIGPLKLFEL